VTFGSQSNSEYCVITFGSETVGAKFHCRKGNSPDPHLRFLNSCPM